jgi:predicted nucleic acid-binding protein
MRALLDTNIIIHRENRTVSNYSIGHLFRWLDKLGYEKLIHPYSIAEIKKYRDTEVQNAYAVKLDAYEVIKTICDPSKEVLDLISKNDKTENDIIDNFLVYEVYCGRVDVLITEDKRLRDKGKILNLEDKILSINQFISVVTAQNPALIDYKALAVKKSYFGSIDISDSFFDSFKRDYQGFESWFSKKCDEEAYICKDDDNKILGFLYLKTETPKENYQDIYPSFTPKLRLKVGTFKVESTGFRLGERFIKIIFDNAAQRNVDEIYVTLFDDREELNALEDLLIRWGFFRYGVKKGIGGDEIVLVKKMKIYDLQESARKNFPNILFGRQKFILPIFKQYHTTLLPDSKLNNENEVNFLEKLPHRYALQKVYISFSLERHIRQGDIVLFFRPGEVPGQKKYQSVITTIGIIDEILYNFRSKEEFFSYCENRTVFTKDELEKFWKEQKERLLVVKFIYVKSLTTRLTLAYLWDEKIVQAPYGPRPFTKLTDAQFKKILDVSETNIKFI